MQNYDESARLRDFDRQLLRSTFVSLFWSAITAKRKRSKYTMQELADTLGRDKSVVSRWFSATKPNWTIDTVADIAAALDLEIKVEARERSTQVRHSAAGPIEPEQFE